MGENILSLTYLIERELAGRKGLSYAVMGVEAAPENATLVWLLCRSCGYCFPANRIAVDQWHGDDCPQCAGNAQGPLALRYKPAGRT